MSACRVVVRVEKGKKRWSIEAMVKVLLKLGFSFASWGLWLRRTRAQLWPCHGGVGDAEYTGYEESGAYSPSMRDIIRGQWTVADRLNHIE